MAEQTHTPPTMAPTLVDEPPSPGMGTDDVMAEVSPLAPVTVTVLSERASSERSARESAAAAAASKRKCRATHTKLDERPTMLETTEPFGSVLTSVLDEGRALEADATAEACEDAAAAELEPAATLLAAEAEAAADEEAAAAELTAAEDSMAAEETTAEEDEGTTTALEDEGGVTGVVEDDSTTGADDTGVMEGSAGGRRGGSHSGGG